MSAPNILRKRLAALSYGITAIASFVLGTIYLLKPTFMPYHAEALGKSWAEVDGASQVLISALMTVAGGGWVSVGVFIVVLLLFPFRNDQHWAIITLPALILLFYIPNLLATLSVLQHTPATPPWYGNAFSCVAAVVGFVLYPWPMQLSSSG